MSDVMRAKRGTYSRQNGRQDQSQRTGAGVAARAPKPKESGQALIEFALALPLLILLVAGIVDFGLAMNTWNTTQNAAREGARIAAISNSEATIKNRAKVTGGLESVPVNEWEVTLACNRPTLNNDFTNCSANLAGDGGACPSGPCATPGNWLEVEGDIVQVTVEREYKFITPLGRLIGRGSSITVKGSIQTRYEG